MSGRRVHAIKAQIKERYMGAIAIETALPFARRAQIDSFANNRPDSTDYVPSRCAWRALKQMARRKA